MKSVIALYKKRGFKVEQVLTDGQVEPWRQELNTNGINNQTIHLFKIKKTQHMFNK